MIERNLKKVKKIKIEEKVQENRVLLRENPYNKLVHLCRAEIEVDN